MCSAAPNPLPAASSPPAGRMLTSVEVAKLFRCTPGTIREWRTNGHLPGAVRLRGRWLFKEAEVLAMINPPA